MFIDDYIIKLEKDLKTLFPGKIPLVTEDGANFIDGKYTPKDNEFVVIVNTGNAAIEKIGNIKSFAAPVYLYIYVPFEERDIYLPSLTDYLVEQSDNDALYEIGNYTAGFAYNTPSCDGKAKKINGKEYALYIIMGSSNYVEGISSIESDVYFDGKQLVGLLNMATTIYPIVEQIGVIGKRFSDPIEIYQAQELNLVVLIDSKNELHKELISLANGGGDGKLFKNIKISNKGLEEKIEFKAYLKLQLNEQNKIIKMMTITVSR